MTLNDLMRPARCWLIWMFLPFVAPAAAGAIAAEATHPGIVSQHYADYEQSGRYPPLTDNTGEAPRLNFDVDLSRASEPLTFPGIGELKGLGE